MTFPREAYEALEGILGPDYVSDDPAVCQAYLRGGEGVGMWDWDRRPPTVVVLPESTEQVQAIVQVANRYQFPYVPISTFMIAFCSPSRPNTIMIDPKRMNQLVIDPQNQMAIVQPYVTYSNLQAECFKYGLFTTSPLCGAQASVLANHLVWSIGQPAHRVSYGHRRILGMEWVLPDGRLLRTGALASGKTDVPFWGEGPG
ncbi:MAG: FAD-binding oxidoreductase, partial [Chloroflexota bacterium]